MIDARRVCRCFGSPCAHDRLLTIARAAWVWVHEIESNARPDALFVQAEQRLIDAVKAIEDVDG